MLALLLLLLLMAAPSWATTYYVDPATGTPATNCTQAQDSGTPHDTIAEGIACTTNGNGDTVYLRSGTYTEQINLQTPAKQGAAGAYLTIAGYPGETVTIRYTEGANGYGNIKARGNLGYIAFENLVLDGVNLGEGTGWQIRDGNHHFILRDIEIKNQHYNGLYIAASDVTIEETIIHDANSTTCVPGTRWQGIYHRTGDRLTVTRTRIYNNPGGGIQIYYGPISNDIVQTSSIYNNSTCSTTDVGGIVVYEDGGQAISGVIIRRNLIYGNGGTGNGSGIRLGGTSSTGPASTSIYNNTIYNNQSVSSSGFGRGIWIENTGVTGTTIKNNIITGNEYGSVLDSGSSTVMTYNACTSGETCTTANKTTIAAITDCTVSVSDFTHKSGSSCINAGVDVGLPFNTGTGKTKPDIGAFETIVFGSCAVASGTPTVVNISLTNNVAPPILPASPAHGGTALTAREDAGAKTTSSTAIVGDNQVNLTVSAAFTGGTAIDFSCGATCDITDSSLIGGTLNQPLLAITNQSCTNNTAGAPTYTFTQGVYIFRSLYGTEAAAPQKPDGVTAENISRMEVMVGGAIRIRLSVLCGTSDCPATGFSFYYAKNGGAYAAVPASFGADNVAMCGTVYGADVPSSATTNILSGGTGFEAGLIVLTANTIPTVNLNHDTATKTDLEYCVHFDTDATAGDYYDFRVRKQDGSVLDTYTNTPRLTLAGASGGSGF